jgi:predicted permease
MQDIVLGLRRLRATPGFAAFAIVTLALGIGVTTAIYSIVRAVLGPPPGVTTIDRLVTITHARGGSIPIIALSYGDYLDLRDRQTTFQDLAGWAFHRFSFTGQGASGSGFGEIVSGDYFQVLGVGPAHGRVLQPADDTPSAAPVAVLGYTVWQRVFNGAPDVVGQPIRINGSTFEVVGVAAREFAGLFNNGLIASTVWIPMSAARTLPRGGTSVDFDTTNRSRRWVQVRARLRPEASVEQARAEVTALAQQLDREAPIGLDLPQLPRGRWPEYQTRRPWVVRATTEVYVNETADRMVRPMAAVLLGAVGLVLLVACTNLANLMLARHSRRRSEAGVRLALGASRLRLVRESLAEVLLLAALGGAAGLGVARVLLVLLGQDLQMGAGASLHVAPALDLAALGCAGAAALVALLVAGVLPAFRASRVDLRSALASENAAASPRWRGRRYLITLQVGVSALLVALAGLCIAQVRQQRQIDSGVDLDRLAFVDVDFGAQQYAADRVRQIVDAALGQLAQQGVAAAVSSGLPVGIGTPGATLEAGDAARTPRLELVASTPGIFGVLGVPIVQGRGFTDRDTASGAPVIVIDERTAAGLFVGSNALGRTVTFRRTRWAQEAPQPEKLLTVIGIAGDTDSGSIGRRDGGVAYVPFAQQYEEHLVLSARDASGDADALPGVLRRTLSSIDPAVAVTRVGTGETFLGELTLFFRVVGGLSSVLGTLALVVALAGLFGVLSHVVASRTREIGIRLALGAGRRRILSMVLREGLSPVLLGLGAGLGLAVLARFGLQPMFTRLLPALDVMALAVVPLLFLGAGVAACYLPARRAAAVDPKRALRDL